MYIFLEISIMNFIQEILFIYFYENIHKYLVLLETATTHITFVCSELFYIRPLFNLF